jgi:hypothetical protein
MQTCGVGFVFLVMTNTWAFRQPGATIQTAHGFSAAMPIADGVRVML